MVAEAQERDGREEGGEGAAYDKDVDGGGEGGWSHGFIWWMNEK